MWMVHSNLAINENNYYLKLENLDLAILLN